jgi:hypothetical protein
MATVFNTLRDGSEDGRQLLRQGFSTTFQHAHKLLNISGVFLLGLLC